MKATQILLLISLILTAISKSITKFLKDLEEENSTQENTTQNTSSGSSSSGSGSGGGIGEDVPIISKRYKNNDTSTSILFQVENLANPFLMFHVAIMEKLGTSSNEVTQVLNEYFGLHLYLQPNLQIVDAGVKIRALRGGSVVSESIAISNTNNTPVEFEFPTSYTYQAGDVFEFYTPNTGVTFRNWYNQDEVSLTPNQYYQLN